MEPSDARRRGRLPGHAARRRHAPAASAPTRPAPGRASTRSTAPREVLDRLNAYEPRRPVIDGLEYHEGLNAVFISGGVAGNVLPDECTVAVNYRFAPDRAEAEARRVRPRGLRRLRGRASPTPPPARCPGSPCRPRRRSSRRSAARRTRSSAGPTWPGSARSASRRSTSGPATRMLAHKQEEYVPLEQITTVERAAAHLAGGGAVTTCVRRTASVPEKFRGRTVMRRDQVDDRHHRPAAARLPRPDRLGAHRPVAGAADPDRVRRGLRRARRARAGDRGVRLGPHHAPTTRRTPLAERLGRAAGRGRLRGDHRRRPGRDGGRQQGRQRGRRRLASGSASSCPSSPASTSGSTSGSTSATSSPARRCS